MTIQNVDYSTKIPNNVNLVEDRQVLRALESWHPGYIDWWMNMGPSGFQEALVYLRTAVSVDPKGWAKFDYVKMPDYRWGVLLAPQEDRRTILVVLTAKGSATLERARAHHRDGIERHFAKHLSQADVKALTRALEKVSTHARPLRPGRIRS